MKQKLTVPDTGVPPRPYCPGCLNYWIAGMREKLHTSCRQALNTLSGRR